MILLVLPLTALILVWLAWLAFMIFFPRHWERFIDWEHEFFLRRGLVSDSVSREFKQLEKGFALKAILAATVFLSLLAMATILARFVFRWPV